MIGSWRHLCSGIEPVDNLIDEWADDGPVTCPDSVQIGWLFFWPRMVPYAAWRDGYSPVECIWDDGTYVEYH